MNIDKLYVGQEIKNYRELCRLLNEDIKDSNSQKAQIKEWKRYFDFEKDGRKFIITEIYDSPINKEDGRNKGNNTIYVNCIELLLMYYLSQKEGHTHTFTSNELYNSLAFMNNKYLDYRKYGNNKQVLEDLQNTSVTNFDLNNFNARTNMKFKKTLFDALKSLRNRMLLEFEEQTYISKLIDNQEIHKQATEKEIEIILSVKKNVLSEMGFAKLNSVYLSFKGDEFKEKVNKILFETYKWRYSYKKYKIIFLSEQIKHDIPLVEIDLQKKMLNHKIIHAIDSEAEKKYNNNEIKIKNSYDEKMKKCDIWGLYELEDFKRDTSDFVYNKNYVESQKCLSDYFLKIFKS